MLDNCLIIYSLALKNEKHTNLPHSGRLISHHPSAWQLSRATPFIVCPSLHDILADVTVPLVIKLIVPPVKFVSAPHLAGKKQYISAMAHSILESSFFV